MQILVLGAAVMGIAGAMLTTLDRQFTPGSYQPLRFTFPIWAMVIVGGPRHAQNIIFGRDSPGLSGIKWDKWDSAGQACQRRLKIRPKGGAKDCHLGWWSDLGVRLGVGDAVRGFFGGSGQRSHAELKRSAPAGRPQGGMVYRIGVSLATRALGARCRPGPSDGVPQFSYRHCFCGRGFG